MAASLLSRTPIYAPRLVALLVASLPALAAAQNQPEFQVHVEKDLMVAMRDGVQLATDVYRPARDGQPVEDRSPVILTRTPYDKSGNASIGQYYAARGYVFVAQDTRGRYKSEGVWHWLTDDGPDGVDCAAWIAAAAVVQRQDRHDRHVVRRRHAARAGHARARRI